MNYEKKQEIPFGAFDSELMRQEISIPDGFEAVIEGNKIILTKSEIEDERIRKTLIDFFSKGAKNGCTTNNIPDKDIIAWLEKQGQKLAWSEEDEHRVKDTIYFLDTAKKHYASTVELDACINWLKSLKDRYTWKPSDEQMKFLQKCIEAYNEVTFPTEVRVLSSLYNDLKKLKGE